MHSRHKILACSLLAMALLIATSQYLAHFHIPQAHASAQPHLEPGMDSGGLHDGAQEHCSLCLQFDRLPAPPAAPALPVTWFFEVAALEAERLARLALDTPQLWPPSRGPPALTC
jgi:hypothetical protein